MSGYYHPENLLDQGKAKMNQFHREQNAVRLAREAQSAQPSQIKIAVNKMVNFFKPLPQKKEQPQPQPITKTATESI